MIGENYGASIESHGGQLGSGQFDSLLDFSFKDIAKDFIAGNIDSAIDRTLEREKLMDKRKQQWVILTVMMKMDSDLDKEGNNNGVYDKEEIDKFKLAVSLQMTSKDSL